MGSIHFVWLLSQFWVINALTFDGQVLFIFRYKIIIPFFQVIFILALVLNFHFTFRCTLFVRNGLIITRELFPIGLISILFSFNSILTEFYVAFLNFTHQCGTLLPILSTISRGLSQLAWFESTCYRELLLLYCFCLCNVSSTALPFCVLL